jgi:hypothetical protein
MVVQPDQAVTAKLVSGIRMNDGCGAAQQLHRVSHSGA